jgi:hypothetical protein
MQGTQNRKQHLYPAFTAPHQFFKQYHYQPMLLPYAAATEKGKRCLRRVFPKGFSL